MCYSINMEWKGQFGCHFCKRENLSASEFSTKALQNFRSKAKKPLKCKECVNAIEQEERNAAAKRLLLSAVENGNDAETDMFKCSSCNSLLAKVQFNRNQLNNKKEHKRCRTCVDAAGKALQNAISEAKMIKIKEFSKKLESVNLSDEALQKSREAVKARENQKAQKTQNSAKSNSKVRKAINEIAKPAYFKRTTEMGGHTAPTDSSIVHSAQGRDGSGAGAVHEQPRKAMETKEERAAYFRAQAALKKTAEMGGHSAPASITSSHPPSDAVTVCAAAMDSVNMLGKRTLAQVHEGHDDARYIKKIVLDKSNGNGQNKKLSFE